MKHVPVAVALAALAGTAAAAGPLLPYRYDMHNGHGQASGGSFNHWDLGYHGAGIPSFGDPGLDNDYLHSGAGELVDGVVSSLGWSEVENVGGTGPYVGWRAVVLPVEVTILFHFPIHAAVDSVSIHADASGGASLPDAVRLRWVAGDAQDSRTFAVADPGAGASPSWLTFAGLDIAATPWMMVTLVYGGEWLFVDEVTFTGTLLPVPEPAPALLLAGGLAALAWRRRRRA